MNAESFIKQKEITWDKPFSNWNRTAFKKALNEFAEMQKQAINYSHCCKSDSEQLVCDHEWIHNTHSDTKYCRKGCDGFEIHEAN